MSVLKGVCLANFYPHLKLCSVSRSIYYRGDRSFCSRVDCAVNGRTINSQTNSRPRVLCNKFFSKPLVNANSIRVFSSVQIVNKSSTESYSTNSNTYEEEEVQVEGKDVPAPFLSFDDYGWPKKIKNFLDKNKYRNPTSIQAQGWPICLEGRDCIGIAQTGSGKTLAYLLPAFVHIDNVLAGAEKRIKDPIALVLAPTRELVTQIAGIATQVNFCPTVALFGGESKLRQAHLLDSVGPRLIIATPGRFIDFMEDQIFSIENISFLVMDEADRMLDMGFTDQIRKIMNNLPQQRQTVMWTATWPQEVQIIANQYMKKDAVQIYVGSKEIHANPNITQKVIVCDNMSKDARLKDILSEIMKKERNNRDCKILIFAGTKLRVDRLPRRIMSFMGSRALAIHGGMTQNRRTKIYNAFKAGDYQVLVATDIAARGLDVQNIDYVINYDMPYVLHDYVHRIGRTGRHGKKGVAYSFLSPDQSSVARGLIKIMMRNNQEIDPALKQLAGPSRLTDSRERRPQRDFEEDSDF